MARDARPQGDALAARLSATAAAPEGSDFFHLLRAVEAALPDLPRLGESTHPAQDALRIGQKPSMAFAPRPVSGLTVQDDGPARLRTFFFGLFGPNGPLPLHLTEHAHARALHERDHTFSHFADMLQHRMATLFYRAWAGAEPAVGHDRPEGDIFADQVGALAGYGMGSLKSRDAMPDLLKWHFTGRLASGARNPEGLAAILSSYFEVPIQIEEFVPTLALLPPEARCRLGGGAGNAALGITATAGRHVRIHHHAFRIVVGPMDLAAYQRFLPGGTALHRLAPIVRNYVGEALEWELNLALAAPEVPVQRLGASGRLGLTSWLARRRSPQPARDLTLGRASRERGPRQSVAVAKP